VNAARESHHLDREEHTSLKHVIGVSYDAIEKRSAHAFVGHEVKHGAEIPDGEHIEQIEKEAEEEHEYQ